MANNEERYCNHCRKETFFFLESDLIWYCDECEHPFDSKPVMDINSPEFEEALNEFEEEYGEAIYCEKCGNFLVIAELGEDICPYCVEEVDIEQLEEKGYSYDEKKGWIKGEV